MIQAEGYSAKVLTNSVTQAEGCSAKAFPTTGGSKKVDDKVEKHRGEVKPGMQYRGGVSSSGAAEERFARSVYVRTPMSTHIPTASYRKRYKRADQRARHRKVGSFKPVRRREPIRDLIQWRKKPRVMQSKEFAQEPGRSWL